MAGRYDPKRVINRSFRHYSRWYVMCKRCMDSKNAAYHLYGGLGIGIDWMWHPDNPNGLANFDEWLTRELTTRPEIVRPRVCRNKRTDNYGPDTCYIHEPHTCSQKRVNVLLTEKMVIDIRQFKKQNLLTSMADLASKYGINQMTLYKALTGRSWASVDKVEAPLPRQLSKASATQMHYAGKYDKPEQPKEAAC